MKYIMTLFWGFILGHVAFYLGSSLTSSPYNVVHGSLVGVFVAIGVVLVANIIKNPLPVGTEESSENPNTQQVTTEA
ncbi:YjzD family protein [Vaginisenegalia massiliensis]|uniref:YjzD family protein n=1 Tax=Vaginisenegalia massiliensis TaxID=2058294 RepID=UPI000F51DF0B|nr:YjzD family protein [Vaginisenegalia massiliensis]